jgi:hypothetical protein
MSGNHKNPNVFSQPWLGLACGATLALISLLVGLLKWRPEMAGDPMVHWAALKGIALGEWTTSDYIEALKSTGLLPGLAVHAGLPVVGIFASIILAYLVGRSRDLRRHVRGARSFAGRKSRRLLAKQLRRELRQGTPTIHLAPDLPALARSRATRGILALGGIGRGKTQFIYPIAAEATSREGARTIIYDNKGDMTGALQGIEKGTSVLIAPWDVRGTPWNVAADVRTPQDARRLARIAIPESPEPMWSYTARMLLTAALVVLQREKPSAWSFADVVALLQNLDNREVRDRLRAHSPETSSIVHNLDSKTGQSIQVNLGAHLAPFADLATAWPEPAVTGFSIRQWLAGKGVAKTVILQGSEEFSELRQPLAGAMLAVTAAIIASPTFPESSHREIYIVVDELPQLGRVRELIKLVETGRSKGVVPIYGIQDIAQVRQVYGDEDAQLLLSTMGTHIVCGVQPGATADALSQAIGEREIDRPAWDADDRLTYQRVMERVVLPAELSALQAGRHGVDAKIIGFGDIYQIRRPITPIPSVREAVILTSWASGAQ